MLISYVPSEFFTAQGTYASVKKRYQEYQVSPLGGGNGNWKVCRNSDILLNGESCREQVLMHYGRSRLTANLYDRF